MQPAADSRQALADVYRDLRRLEIPYEEWEVLFREALLVERALATPASGTERQPLSVAAGVKTIAELAEAIERLASTWRRALEPERTGAPGPGDRRVA